MRPQYQPPIYVLIGFIRLAFGSPYYICIIPLLYFFGIAGVNFNQMNWCIQIRVYMLTSATKGILYKIHHAAPILALNLCIDRL